MGIVIKNGICKVCVDTKIEITKPNHILHLLPTFLTVFLIKAEMLKMWQKGKNYFFTSFVAILVKIGSKLLTSFNSEFFGKLLMKFSAVTIFITLFSSYAFLVAPAIEPPSLANFLLDSKP